MRTCRFGLALASVVPLFFAATAGAQVVSGTPAGNAIIQTNGVFVGVNPAATVNPPALTPNLASSNATPAIGRPGITPAMPNPGAPAITPQNIAPALAPQRGFTMGIGRQGFGGAIGQQGSGTAIGQQGSGTAIGQQGVGTAIIPPTNAIVIGQPEPFSPPPVSTPSAVGFSTNGARPFGPSFMTNNAGAITGAPAPVLTSPGMPLNRQAPAPRRR